jgi:hypothetical protein
MALDLAWRDLAGNGKSDGQLIAAAFAEILRVPLPDQP